MIDSYESPAAERLLRLGRQRHAHNGGDGRLLITELSFAAAFIAAAGLLAAIGSSGRPWALTGLAVGAGAYLIAQRVRFAVGSAWTAPTQVIFVPMLFMLPTPWVPVVVGACSAADQLPAALRGQATPSRVAARVGDAFYALGPALVLVLFGREQFAWSAWPILLLAFVAQVVLDAGAGLSRTWAAERVPPTGQRQMVWLYITDACLSCVGLLIASATSDRPGLLLLVLPLLGLLWLLARERQQRLDYALALSTAYRGIASLLGHVVEADDDYTGAHSRDVVNLSRATAESLRLDAAERRAVEYVAMLHDIGKISVPKEILHKSGRLSDDEWVIIRHHTIAGEKMLAQVGGALASVGRYVRASHERYDGRGYPDRLAGERIPIASRIVSVCDAYSAMTTDRPYRAAMPATDALDELRRCAGTQFDPEVVEALERVVA